MTTVRKILRDFGLHPRKHLGQSFLEDKNIINKIIRIADIQKEDVIVEIGAGLGVMTEQLALVAARIIAIDVDPGMIAVLRERLQEQDNVEIVEGDIMSFDFSIFQKGSKFSDKIKVIGNVPYNISTPILFHLLKYRHYISEMVLLLQKEVVDRITALPGTKEYGIPSVIVDMHAVATREMNVPADCFFPSPKVTSSLLKLVIRKKSLVPLDDEDFFSRVVKNSFLQRRKTLLNNLRRFCGALITEEGLAGLLSDLDIACRRRGETLTTTEFAALSNALFQLSNKAVSGDSAVGSQNNIAISDKV